MTVDRGREARVVSGDAVIAVRDEGNGPPVLFSHGGFLTMSLFDAPAALMAENARCIRWDHRGQGASSSGSGYGRREYLERVYTDALAVVEHFGVTSCHWVGQSIGAFVGMRIAANHPDLVRSLVLLSPRVRANPLSFKLRVELMGQALRAASHSQRLDDPVRDTVATYVMSQLFGKTFMQDPSRVEAREAFRRDLRGRLTRPDFNGLRGVFWYPENRPEMIAEIAAPTLIITGEEDLASDASGVTHAREVAALIRNSTLMVVPAAGHALLMEQPETVSMAIRDFIDQHDDGAGRQGS